MGKYPKEAVIMMNKIIQETEESPYDDVDVDGGYGINKNDGVGKSVNILIRETGIKQVVDLSKNELYRYVSKWRPEVNVFVATDKQNLYSNLFWGVQPFIIKSKNTKSILRHLKKKKLLKKNFILLTEEDRVEIVD